MYTTYENFSEIMRFAASYGASKATIKAVWREHMRQLRLSESPSKWKVAFRSDDEVLEKRFFPGEWSQEEVGELLKELWDWDYPQHPGMFLASLDAYPIKGGVWVYCKSVYHTS